MFEIQRETQKENETPDQEKKGESTSEVNVKQTSRPKVDKTWP